MDISDEKEIDALAARVTREHPEGLYALVNNNNNTSKFMWGEKGAAAGYNYGHASKLICLVSRLPLATLMIRDGISLIFMYTQNT